MTEAELTDIDAGANDGDRVRPATAGGREGIRRRTGVVATERFELALDGVALYVRDWVPESGARRGVYLLHGLGEHVGRYDALARWFCARGWRVRAHDYVGHGHSPGRRGVIARHWQLTAHAQALLESFQAELDSAPLLLGHSLGGALAAELVACRHAPVGGLVLSSPAIDPGLNPAQRLLTAMFGAIAPDLALRNGLDPRALSHDPIVVRAYRDDPLVHDRISARLVRWLLDAGVRATQAASGVQVPTLLLVAGSDRLVNPRGTREFARRVPADRLRMHWYDGLYHEIFNERDVDRARVLGDLDTWLETLSKPPPC